MFCLHTFGRYLWWLDLFSGIFIDITLRGECLRQADGDGPLEPTAAGGMRTSLDVCAQEEGRLAQAGVRGGLSQPCPWRWVTNEVLVLEDCWCQAQGQSR